MARDAAAHALEIARTPIAPAREPEGHRPRSQSPPLRAEAVAELEAAVNVIDWERLWLAIQRSSWMSIALVPIGEGISTPQMASALAEVGRQHLGGRIVVTDATKVSLSTLQASLSALLDCEARAIVALSPLSECPAGVEIARAADAVVVCITLGRSAIAEAEKIVHEVGREHVIGAVIVRERRPEP